MVRSLAAVAALAFGVAASVSTSKETVPVCVRDVPPERITWVYPGAPEDEGEPGQFFYVNQNIVAGTSPSRNQQTPHANDLQTFKVRNPTKSPSLLTSSCRNEWRAGASSSSASPLRCRAGVRCSEKAQKSPWCEYTASPAHRPRSPGTAT